MLDFSCILTGEIPCALGLGWLPVTETRSQPDGSNRSLIRSHVKEAKGRQSKMGVTASNHYLFYQLGKEGKAIRGQAVSVTYL